MNYEKITWQAGDTITAGKLNRIEQGIQDAADALGDALQETDFKTINDISIIGEGNITIAGMTELEKQEIAKIKLDLAELSAAVENLQQNGGTSSAEIYKGEIKYN